MSRLVARIRRWWRENIVSDDPYYGWADMRLDEMEREKR